MERIELTSKCTGCAACSNVCKQNAIDMVLDENGFYKPTINEERCIGCGACTRVCPVEHPKYNNVENPICYAFMASDEVRDRSSSGGAFEILANEILMQGGAVFGVAYKEDFTTRHICIENLTDLWKLRGSKYVMSDVGEIYREVKKKINSGKKVLFSGTPCQVAGLNNFLGDDVGNESLLTVDLICHGIPSVKAFKKYIEDVHGKREIKYIGYKEKKYGWHASMTIDFVEGDRYNEPCEKDPYFWSYLSGVNKNSVCGSCPYAQIPRQGDITIGDYWGISNYKKELNDGKGTSVMLLNNKKGQAFLDKIRSKAKMCVETPLEPAIKGNSNLISSPKLHVSRNQFFKNLLSRRFGELSKWSYATERYDIGIVGIPTYVNFGGALTYFALFSVLSDKGYSVCSISRPRSCGRPPIMPDVVYEKNPYPPNSLKLEFKDKEAMREMNNICETFLVGSDQLFNADLYYKFGEIVTLDWVNDNHRKVAYAASFGHSVFWGREEQRAKMAHYMQKFDAFSVREEDGVALAENTFGIKAEWVLDPVFLCDKKHYEHLAENASNKSKKPHIFAYILDPDEEKNEILSFCQKKLQLDVELFSEMLFKPTETKLAEEQRRFEFKLRQAKIEERLYSLINSKYIVADSFHGICFAIIFEIPFVAILNKNRGATRFYTILKKFNLLDRLVTNMEEARAVLDRDVDFTISREILRNEKERCINWLLNALEPQDGVKKAYSSDDILIQKFDVYNKKNRISEMKVNALIAGKVFNTVSNIYQYLEMIQKYKDELIVIIAVRDTPGMEINDKIDSLLNVIGSRISLLDKHWKSYVYVMDGENILSEVISKRQERVAYNGTIQGKSYKVVSRSYNQGDIAAIQIDGIEYAENKRGLNIVLIDKMTNEVIDSVAFDTHNKTLPCFRNGSLCKTDYFCKPISQPTNIQDRKAVATEIKINSLMCGRIYNTVSDIHQYLDMIQQYKGELITIIAVRDTAGFELNSKIDSLLKRIGCECSLLNKHWQSYLFIMDGGVTVSEVLSRNQEKVMYAGVIQGRNYHVVSQSYNQGDSAIIQIDEVDYAENQRGLNIVLIDKRINEVVDSVVFDTHDKQIPCYRNGKLCQASMTVDVNSASEKNMVIESKVKKNEIISENSMNGIKKENEVLLHNALVISAVGGCSLDYYVDKGIKEIAIYGTDLLVAFLWEQAYYKGIKVVKLFSDKHRVLDIRLPRDGNIELEDIHNINVKEISVPIIVAEAGYPAELLVLKKEGKNIYRYAELNMYSHIKNVLLDPVLNYKKQYPYLKIGIFNMPAVYEIENPTDYEILLRKSLMKEAAETRCALFRDLGYDETYAREVMQRINVITNKDVDFICDKVGKYVNVVNGYRVTTDIPVDFENTIYLFGNSVCYGLGAHDEYTIGSVLQREVNEYYKGKTPYAVLNCSNGARLNCKQQFDSFRYHMPQNGDSAVFIMNGFNELVKEIYGDKFIWIEGKEVLNRPHNLGEVFLDINHVTAKGYEACGKLLARKLLENNYGIEVSETKQVAIPTQSTSITLEENQEVELKKYLESIDVFRGDKTSGTIGSIVMNCNPFTLGHRYLIETSSKKCDILYIFVVEEDKSIFSFEDRIELVRKGTKDLSNVIVIPSGKFIISQLTFNAYFQKEENNDVEIDPSNDVQLFATRIAPYMGITKRFAGDEPLDKVTNQYNATMKRILPKFGIEFEVIKRKEEDGEVISASRVRSLLQNKEFQKIKHIVPKTTYDYLYNRYKDSKRVLVLGGTRFMGIRLVEHMIEKNWLITLGTRGIHKDSFGKNVTRIKLDRKNERSIGDALKEKEFDYVFDNIAYTGNDVKRLLPYIKCKNYIQVSSVAIYSKHHLELKEDEVNSYEIEYISSDNEKNYGVAKRAAECVALQQFPDVSTTIVRIPFVVEPENLDNKELNMRLFFYVEHIMQKRAMKVDNFDYSCTFVRTGEEADFLIYLAENNFSGIYNFSSKGSITVKEIIEYIENKSGIKAIYSDEGDMHPFRAAHFGQVGYSYDLTKALKTGYPIVDLKDWIYNLLDNYMEMFK